MRFEKFDSTKHNITQIADLVYDVDFRTFDSVYKNKNNAIRDISRMLEKHELDHFYVVLEDGKVMGIVKFHIHNKPSFIHSLLGFTSFKLLLIDILDYFVLSEVNDNDLHIAMLAISDKYRGKGVGSKVLNKVIKHGKKGDFKRITLDADFRNDGAKKLYEKMGFRKFDKKSLKIGKFERGMYNMEYIL